MLVGSYPFEDPEDPRNFRKTISRITIPEIRKHPWFQKNLPREIIEVENSNYIVGEQDQPSQSIEEIMRIILEAKKPAQGSKVGDLSASGLVHAETSADAEEVDNGGDFSTPI